MKKTLLITLFAGSLLMACQPEATEEASTGIDSARMMNNIKELSSDEFEGRAPFGKGEELTLQFLTNQFTALGAKPGNGESFLQEVPLVSSAVTSSPVLSFTSENLQLDAQFGSDQVVLTQRVADSIRVNDSELVFVGYGIHAPEFGWNDYEGLDVEGKTVLMLVNDPGYATQVDSVFNGNAMTYYGRWTYKYEEAARQGATGVILIHQTGAAGYPWEVVNGSWTGTRFGLVKENNNADRCAFEAWITEDVAKQLFTDAGLDFEAVTAEATTPEFTFKPMGIQVSVDFQNELSRSASNNFISIIPGTESPEEYIIYTAHWDHLGVNPNVDGDQIFNGAVDNATGTAALIEIAAEFIKNPPKRSVVFLAVTAEEQGLLGSAYYANAPIYAPEKTVAVINIDAIMPLGKMKDIIIVGYGNSELDGYLEKAAAESGMNVIPDPEPEKGYFYRSDHFSFAKVGIPALYAEGGHTSATESKDWVAEQKADYVANRYHKPGDEWNENWDISGMLVDMQLYYRVGSALANSSDWPEWSDGVAFKSARKR